MNNIKEEIINIYKRSSEFNRGRILGYAEALVAYQNEENELSKAVERIEEKINKISEKI